jgi:uncharacterized caspase-like protein/tetratricopeptide (TPR) repeat protein
VTQEEAKAGRVPKLWAVIVGVSRYQFGEQEIDGNRVRNLKNAADDAQAVYDFLRSPEGGGFRDVSEGGHMTLLKDERATRDEVERALAALRQSEPEDYFVVYVAAHGTLLLQQDPASAGTVEVPYFLLYDADLRDATRTALRMEAFRRSIEAVPARKGLVLSDTCHSAGVQLAGRDAAEDAARANKAYLEEMSKVVRGVGYISAAGQLEKAYERDSLGHGVFTYCLLNALRGNGDTDRDGKVTFDELVGYLRVEVPRLTERKQNPFVITSAVEANYLPLSLVSYATGGRESDTGGYGVLVIRAPDIDGASVAIDGVTFDTLDSRAPRAIKVKAGPHRLSFVKGGMRRDLSAVVEPGQTTVFEVNLAFSEGDEEALVPPSVLQTNVYLRSEREPATAAQELFHRGVESFKRQKFAEAADLFTRAMQANGGAYANAGVYRGRAEQSLNRHREAVASFSAALRARPSDYETRTLLAEARFNAGDSVTEIERELRAVISDHPAFEYARVVLGDLLLWRGDLPGAEQELKRAVSHNPLSPPAHLILADVLILQEGGAKAREALKAAEEALRLFDEVSRKQVSAARGLKGLSISHLIFGGGKYVNRAALAEANHMLARALMNAVEKGDQRATPEAYLDRASLHLRRAGELAQTLPDQRRLAFVLASSAENYRLKKDVKSAIEEGRQALKLSESLRAPELTTYAHLTLSRAYESSQQYRKAALHLHQFIAAYDPRMSPKERQSYQEDLRRLRRLADDHRQSR